MSNTDSLLRSAVTAAAAALGLPPIVEPLLVDLLETIAHAPDAVRAIHAAKQNALADAEDTASEADADAILKRGV